MEEMFYYRLLTRICYTWFPLSKKRDAQMFLQEDIYSQKEYALTTV